MGIRYDHQVELVQLSTCEVCCCVPRQFGHDEVILGLSLISSVGCSQLHIIWGTRKGVMILPVATMIESGRSL